MSDMPRKPPVKPLKKPLSAAALARLAKRPKPADLRKIERLRRDGVII